MPEPTPIAVAARCHTARVKPDTDEQEPKGRQKRWPPAGRQEPPAMLLVIDTETATRETSTMPGFEGPAWEGTRQSLLFGRMVVAAWNSERQEYTSTCEYVFYPDNLPEEGTRRLREALPEAGEVAALAAKTRAREVRHAACTCSYCHYPGRIAFTNPGGLRMCEDCRNEYAGRARRTGSPEPRKGDRLCHACGLWYPPEKVSGHPYGVSTCGECAAQGNPSDRERPVEAEDHHLFRYNHPLRADTETVPLALKHHGTVSARQYDWTPILQEANGPLAEAAACCRALGDMGSWDRRFAYLFTNWLLQAHIVFGPDLGSGWDEEGEGKGDKGGPAARIARFMREVCAPWDEAEHKGGWGLPQGEQTARRLERAGVYLAGKHGPDWHKRLPALPDPASPVLPEEPAPVVLLPLSEFLEVFYWLACHTRRQLSAGGPRALVVGFNLPFDLSRLACGVGTSAGKRFRDGFTFTLWEKAGKEDRCRPRLQVKHIGNKRNFIGWASHTLPASEPGGKPRMMHYADNFLDVHTLARALTGDSYTLGGAAGKFLPDDVRKGEPATHGVITPEYVSYNRQDCAVTLALANHFLRLLSLHPIASEATGLFSPASLAKGYLRAMGIQPRLKLQEGFPPEVLGHSMQAYYGGRTDVMLRKVSVPVVHTDFTSMYPTVNALMGLWQHVTAERIECQDATAEVQALLDGITLEDCFRPDTWQKFVGIALVKPCGDVLPVRGQYGADWNIGLNPYWGEEQWFTIPDLIAAKVLSENGQVPQVLRAIRFAPVGKQAGLREIALRGKVKIDPAGQDFFRRVVEERQRVKKGKGEYAGLPEEERENLQGFLKLLANSGSYGVYVELNAERETKAVAITVYAGEPHSADVGTVEEPGTFYFPPVGTLITGAARLMLALLERCVRNAGGSFVTCDTDSMMIVADRERKAIPVDGAGRGGERIRQEVTALSWEEVNAIVGKFAALNPYDRDAVPGSVLKVEDDNFGPDGRQRRLWCWAISAKRYCLHDNEGSIVDAKESGMGFFLDPRPDRNQEANKHLARAVYGVFTRSGYVGDLSWADDPMVRHGAVTTPNLRKRFALMNEGRPYAEQMKPFSFYLEATFDFSYQPETADDAGGMIAPYDPEPAHWRELPWAKYQEPKAGPFRITTEAPDPFGRPPADRVQVRSYGGYFWQYQNHPERPYLGPDGEPCGAATIGVLTRRPVSAVCLKCIGKDGTDLEEAEAALVQDAPAEYCQEGTILPLALAVLKDMPQKDLAAKLGVGQPQVSRYLSGQDKPEDTEPPIRLAQAFAREALAQHGQDLHGAELLRQYAEWRKYVEAGAREQIARMSIKKVRTKFGVNAERARAIKEGRFLPEFSVLRRVFPGAAIAFFRPDGALPEPDTEPDPRGSLE